jgi:hypothetical protein
MATDARSRLITLHFSQAGRNHGIRMELGTAQALGISNSQIGVGFVMRQVTTPNTQRRLYAGGPFVDVNGSTKERAVAVGPGSGKARTNKKLIIKDNSTGASATIYHSGPMQSAVAWLKANANIAANNLVDGYSLYSPTGRPVSFKAKPATA